MNAQLSFTLAPDADPFDLAVAPVLASEAFADLCRTLTRDRDIVAAVTVRAEQLRASWNASISPTAWAHALARTVVLERHRARRDYERQVVPLRPNLYGTAMTLTRDPSEADDLVQDTMLRAWRFWATFTQGTDLKAWLFTVLRNTFINGYHARGRKRDGQNSIHTQMLSLGPTVALGLSDSTPEQPDTVVDCEREKSAIADALAQLPEAFREAVQMCDLEGMAYKEISEALGVPIGTIMSRIHRGRKVLRRLLGEAVTRHEWAVVCCRGDSYADTAMGAAAFRDRLESQGFDVVEVERGPMFIRLHASRAVDGNAPRMDGVGEP